jgi:hypothetical protein
MDLLKKIAETDFVHKAMEENANLDAFKQRPDLRVISGLAVIGFSYIIGWPAVGALGATSLYLNKPLLFVIGGPVTYGISHLVFLFGMYLAGAQYSKAFLRWATKVTMERLMKSRKG